MSEANIKEIKNVKTNKIGPLFYLKDKRNCIHQPGYLPCQVNKQCEYKSQPSADI